MLGTQYVLLRSMNKAHRTTSVSVLFPEMGFGALTAVCQSLPSDRVSRPNWQCPLGDRSGTAGGVSSILGISITALSHINSPSLASNPPSPGAQVQILTGWHLPPLILKGTCPFQPVYSKNISWMLSYENKVSLSHLICLKGRVLSAKPGLRVTG